LEEIILKILVTGARGFVGKNLVERLKLNSENELFLYDIDTDPALLDKYTKECEFVFHLAGVNRPEKEEDFMKGNFGFTSILLDKLKNYNNKAPILITSSIQAALDNPYGKSKKAGEDLMREYSNETGAKVYIYRFTNLFGKWCRPNYNSVVATFCYNIANNLPIQVNDENVTLNLAYIDDVVDEILNALDGKGTLGEDGFYKIPVSYSVTLGHIASLIKSFRESRENFYIVDMKDEFTKKLYSTYLSYLPKNEFAYTPKMNIDERGSFTELFKSVDRGQVSVNISKPGIIKGNHWHNTKNEKFVVVSGEALIKFRKVNEEEITEYKVSGDKIEIVDIPCGYTHSIENIGNTDLVTIMWANEVFDKDNPDTYYLDV